MQARLNRCIVVGALKDFEPGILKKKLAKDKARLFQVLGNAKLWDGYQRDYEKKSQNMADWLESVFQRHFRPAYSLATERLKADRDQAPPG